MVMTNQREIAALIRPLEKTTSLSRWGLLPACCDGGFVMAFAAVDVGLRFGAVPLAAALILCRFAPSCPPDVGMALCGTTGLLGGVIITRRQMMRID